jgi:adenine-specific DNA-methyltransferase
MPTLDFKGKQFVYSHHHSVPFRELEVDSAKSLPPQGKKAGLDDNLIIHGDNLHALKALMPQYAGKIKCIYIDPPYNTGNEGWCYNDNVNSPLMKEWLAKNANPVDREDLQRHDKWLCMMWPRLKLLHELLADDGVIFVSIDDNEDCYLKTILDEIFGEGNFAGRISWRRRHNQPNDQTKMIAKVCESIFAYFKNTESYKKTGVGKIALTGTFSNSDNDPRGDWSSKPWKTGDGQSGTIYKITSPSGKIFEEEWMGEEDNFNKLRKDNRIVFPKNGDGFPRKKYFRFEREEEGQCATNWWTHTEFGHNQEATQILAEIFGGERVFDNPKPPRLIEALLDIGFVKSGDIVLDSFAGSGTTAHAVLELNKEDGGNRKFILVQMDEAIKPDSPAYKLGFKRVIEVTAERVRRVIKGVPTAKDEKLKDGLGGSFTFCNLGKEISIEKIIAGESLPDYGALANYVFYTATGKSLDRDAALRADYFVGETDLYEVYLIYQPDTTFLRSNESALNDVKLKAIADRGSKKEKLVFATAKYMGQRELSAHNITFCQLPYAIHKVVGA